MQELIEKMRVLLNGLVTDSGHDVYTHQLSNCLDAMETRCLTIKGELDLGQDTGLLPDRLAENLRRHMMRA